MYLPKSRPARALLLAVLAVPAVAACDDGPTDPFGVADARSELCAEVRGPRAIFWDMQNGIIRTDLPGGVPPTVTDIGGTFFHPDYPPLSFIYPRGWTPETVRGNQVAGVNLIRDDGRAIWRWVGAGINGPVEPGAVLEFEIDQALAFFGTGTDITVLCSSQRQDSPAAGIVLRTHAILFEVDGLTLNVSAQVSTVQGLALSQIVAGVAAGPTAEYDDLIFDPFLAIGFQLLYGRSSIHDSDGDGVADVNDAFPNDPTRS